MSGRTVALGGGGLGIVGLILGLVLTLSGGGGGGAAIDVLNQLNGLNGQQVGESGSSGKVASEFVPACDARFIGGASALVHNRLPDRRREQVRHVRRISVTGSPRP